MVTTEKIVHSTGIVATGVSSAPAETYGNYLSTNGFLLLSYAEWMQIIGCVYIIFLIFKLLKIKTVFKKIITFIKGL